MTITKHGKLHFKDFPIKCPRCGLEATANFEDFSFSMFYGEDLENVSLMVDCPECGDRITIKAFDILNKEEEANGNDSNSRSA